MLDKIRVVVVVGIFVMFALSVFTQYPSDPTTRTTLGALALAAAGFLFGPTLLRGGKNGNGN